MSAAARNRAASAGTGPGSCELAEVMRRYGPEYRRTHPTSVTQRKAMRDIERCRTAALGGHRAYCDDCGFERYLYHSCRNRHCPKCQTHDRAAWVDARTDELLPVPYFHHVFTLPHQLHPLVQYSERNRRALLKLLFDATAGTLLEFGRRDLGGMVGFTLVLHTWDQLVRTHLHLHCLMASGALETDGSRWIAGGRKFLFPVHGLSKMFRAKFLDGLAKLLGAGELDVPPQLGWLGAGDTNRGRLSRWLPGPWVVYSKPPFAGPKKLVEYLGRYTHRVAISNERLHSCDDGAVRFRYRDRRDGDRVKNTTVPADEFIARFLVHVLPDRFLRIRHYGFLANRAKHKLLARCRELLGVAPPANREDRPRTLADWLGTVLGIDPNSCPRCGCPLHQESLPRIVAVHAAPTSTAPSQPQPCNSS
jgi:Putative transposase/Transposase zinc-binding domain